MKGVIYRGSLSNLFTIIIISIVCVCALPPVARALIFVPTAPLTITVTTDGADAAFPIDLSQLIGMQYETIQPIDAATESGTFTTAMSLRIMGASSYSLTETVPSGMTLSVHCSGDDSSIFNYQSDGVVITPLSTNPISCTFANTIASTPHVCTPGVDQDCYDNVLFLPGIEGSMLYGPNTDHACVLGIAPNSTYPDVCQYWDPMSDAVARELRMSADGSSNRDDIYTTGVLDTAYVPGLGHVYHDFLAEMANWHTTFGITAEAVPYDWRLDFSTLLSNGRADVTGRINYNLPPEPGQDPYILGRLKYLAAHSKTGKVTIIAHSMGGLVAKALMQRLGPTTTLQLIDKVVLVASPQAGTPSAIASLLHGKDLALPSQLFQLMNAVTARELVNFMPSAYALIPSRDYFTYVDDPVVTFDPATVPFWSARYGSIIHSQDRLHPFLADSFMRVASTSDVLAYPAQLSDTLLSAAETLHQSIDSWTPPSGVEVVQIAGWGIPTTLKGLDYASTTEGFSVVASTTIDGDGTVVVPSALWMHQGSGVRDYWLDLASYNNSLLNRLVTVGGTNGLLPYNHSSIFQATPLQQVLNDILTGVPIDPSHYGGYITDSAPASTGVRLRFTLHSPLTLDLYDSEGRHTGISTTTGELEEQIPGAYYDEVAGVKYLYTDASSRATIAMRGYAPGTFTFKVDELAGDIPVTSATFQDVPTTVNTIVSMSVGSDITTLSPMLVDENGNGVADYTLVPKLGGTVTPDTTPPEARIAFSTSTRSIVITGTDTQGTATQATSPLFRQDCIQYKKDARGRSMTDCAVYRQVKIGNLTTITDQSGNTLALSTSVAPSGLFSDGHLTTLTLSSLKYSTHIAPPTASGQATTTFNPPVTLNYAYQTDRKGRVTQFNARVTTPATTTYALYMSQSNQTLVIQIAKRERVAHDESTDDSYLDLMDDREIGRRKPTFTRVLGLYMPSVATDNGRVIIK